MTTKLKSPDAKRLPNPTDVRRTILSMLHRSGASHLGTSMSLVEMLIAAYASVDIALIRAHDPARSRVIVSKGHGACATYAAMTHFNLMSMEDALTYHSDGSILCGHVSHAVPGVEHSTGALGHGLPVAVGCAMGLKARGIDEASVFALLGDGEIQEGSVWEALMLIKHRNLSNVITMIDNNRISSITETNKVINMDPLSARFEGFGFQTHTVDGHDLNALLGAISKVRESGEAGVIICNTVKGKGVSFAEHEPIWHYRSLNDETFTQAMADLDVGANS